MALPLILLLFLLLEHSPKLGNQGRRTLSHSPGMLVLDGLQQIRRILVAMGCGRFQIFQPPLPASPHIVSEIVELAQLVFCIGIAILRRLLEVVDCLFDILPAFFLEINFPCNVSSTGHTTLGQFFQQRQSSGNILFHKLTLAEQFT